MGGSEYLHGDWKTKKLVHITTDVDSTSSRYCKLEIDGWHPRKYIFGLPWEHGDAGARVFPICHSVDKAGNCESRYQKCHVEILAGSGCSAEDVRTKLNSVTWIVDHEPQ